MQSAESPISNTPAAPTRLKRRLLLCGESLIGFAGLALAGTILASLSVAGWVSVHQQAAAVAEQRRMQLSNTSKLIAEASQSLLADGDASGVRRLLVAAKSESHLTRCRIELLDGSVIADAQPSKINLPVLPNAWPGGPADGVTAEPPTDGSMLELQSMLNVVGRGRAVLSMTEVIDPDGTPLGPTISALGIVGAIGLLISWGLYRHIRCRVHTLGLIREALLAANPQKLCRDELGLSADHGVEAVAWNRLLEEFQILQQSATAERAKAALGDRREGRGDLEHACDALSVGMIVIDDTKAIKLVNGAAAVLLGAKRDAMIGRPVLELIEDAKVAATLAGVDGNGPQRRVLEIQRAAANGGGTLKLNIRPLRRDDAGSALITLEDITQQRLADASRNNFVSQAAHELRTPLTNMRLCLEDALEGVETDPALIRDQFNMLNTEARRLERIVGEMLSVSEIEAGSLQIKRDDVRLDRLFEELQIDFRSQAASKQLTVNFQLPPKYPVLLGDRDKLMIVLHNLLGNALKYTPTGGTITFAVRPTTSQLVIDITDTGIGINPEDQQKLFTKFYRAKDARVSKIVGTGLGLALAREIARLHGGDVTLLSEIDKGSTFTLALPLEGAAKKAA